MTALTRRIFGIETEYGLTCVGDDGSRRLTPDDAARYLFRKVVQWGKSSNVFLTNGSRLYLDVGSHPEYATCECDGFADVIAHERAGDAILHHMAVEAEEAMHAEGVEGRLFLFKNNTDSAGNSYGCHENYLVARTGDFTDTARYLVPFFITRQLIVGAGKVVQTAKGAHYAISQRADHMWDGVSSATTRSRPIINTRDEPHADAALYRRMHVIVGDSSMSQATSLLKVASTHALLCFLEEHRTMRDFTMENPVKAIREIALDTNGRTLVQLANGTTATALEIQQEYCRVVTAYVQESGITDQLLHHSLDLWARALTAIETDRLDLVNREIDWVIKYAILQRAAVKQGIDMSDARMAQLDMAYHDINPDRGLYYAMERKGLVPTIVNAESVDAARTQPPATTRAKLRGDFVAAALAAGADHTVDWTQLKLSDHGQRSVQLKDPFEAVDARVERLIATL